MPKKGISKADKIRNNAEATARLRDDILHLTSGALRAAVIRAIDIGENGKQAELTDEDYLKMKPGECVTDPNARGLIMRRGSQDAFRWYFRTTDGPGSTRQVECYIGDYPKTSIDDAKKTANELRKLRRRGTIRFSIKKDGRHRAIPAERLLNLDVESVMTMSELVTKFLEEYVDLKKRPSSAKGDRRLLTKYIDAQIGDKPVMEVTGPDLRVIILELSQRAPREAEKLLTVVTTMFNTAFGRNKRIALPEPWLDLDKYPDPLLTIGTLESREANNRAVDVFEARNLYDRAPDVLGPLYGDAARLQLLCACRISEITDLPWAEVNLDQRQIKLPTERTKNGMEHIIYLSDQAVEILEQRRADDPDGVWVFPSVKYPDEHISSDTLSKNIGTNRAALGVDAKYRSHDGRHAFTTWAGEQTIPLEVRNRCTNHKPAKSNIDSVYNHATLKEPARIAWQRWANALAGVADDNVVKFDGAVA
ncbi:site-specific integrase [Ruegeria sp. HKCCA5491]|uniref:tyrosine-type recombinase/integrase n=1 Tax=Ruegeria sp. HKCCA5491 TaxID=2682986 RepID=UPI0014897C68|nr:site-specific integrase [Ruegeria sp. HKCCA5491]